MTMQLGTYLRTGFAGLATAIVASVFFMVLNAGIPLRADDHVGVTDAADYSLVIAGVLSNLSFVTLLSRGFLTRTQTDHPVRPPLARFLAGTWLDTALIGPIIAVLLSLATLIWRTLAAEPGAHGTIWGNLSSSPLSFTTLLFTTLFMAFWASANLGLAFMFFALPMREKTPIALAGLVVLILLVVTVIFGFSWLYSAETLLAFIAAMLALLVSLPIMFSARWFALSQSGAPGRSPSDDRRSIVSLESLGVLNPGERVAASLRNRNRDHPDFLIATDQRIICVRADRHGAVLQLAVQTPWQLAHCRSESFHGQGRVAVEFHNGSHMLIECADPEESHLFASVLNQMARP